MLICLLLATVIEDSLTELDGIQTTFLKKLVLTASKPELACRD